MIDSHCHLADKQFNNDLPSVITRAHDAGITAMVCIADDLVEAQRCQKIAEENESVFFTAGIHPHLAKTFDEQSLETIRHYCAHEKCKAVGEIGLDYHYMNSPMGDQLPVFRDQLHLAKELSMPVVVHTREAIEDTWRTVDKIKPEKIVLHCCTEKWEDVSRFIDAGYFLSFTGIATYPKSDAIRDTIKHCPIEQMMIETDAPYLSPTPHRGKRNEPSYVVEVAKCVAQEKGISLEEVDSVTTQNAIDFYSLKTES